MATVVDIAADLAAAEYWYVHTGELTYGPFTPAQMQVLAQQGRLGKETMIAPAGGGEWRPSSQIIRVHTEIPTPAELASLVGLQPDEADASLPSYENAHPEFVLDEIGLRNQAALSQRSSDQQDLTKPIRVEDREFIAPNHGVILPPVCPRCGGPGTDKRVERYRKSADWLLIFSLLTFAPVSFPWYFRPLGVLPYLAIAGFFGTRGSITMTPCGSCLRKLRVRKLSGFITLGCSALGVLLAVTHRTPQLFALALPLAIVGAMLATDKMLRVKQALKRNDIMEFRFTGGHTRFLVAVAHTSPYQMIETHSETHSETHNETHNENHSEDQDGDQDGE